MRAPGSGPTVASGVDEQEHRSLAAAALRSVAPRAAYARSRSPPAAWATRTLSLSLVCGHLGIVDAEAAPKRLDDRGWRSSSHPIRRRATATAQKESSGWVPKTRSLRTKPEVRRPTALTAASGFEQQRVPASRHDDRRVGVSGSGRVRLTAPLYSEWGTDLPLRRETCGTRESGGVSQGKVVSWAVLLNRGYRRALDVWSQRPDRSDCRSNGDASRPNCQWPTGSPDSTTCTSR